MRVPVVVVHFEAPDWCESSVRAINSSIAVDPDVIVVDNSGEFTRGERLLPDATVVAAGANVGYAGGANMGIRRALGADPTPPYIAVCAHDFHPEPTCLARMVAAAEDDPKWGILGPRLTAPIPSIGSWFDGRRSLNVEPHADAPDVFESDWVSGTCMLLRTECLYAVGGFDEGFRSYVEDVDLCLRVRDAGWRVGAVVDAAGHGLGSVSSVRFQMTATNVALLAAKREGAWAAWMLVARYVGRCLRSCLVTVLPSPRGLSRRRASLRYARSRGSAAWELLRSRRINEYARTPSHAEPSLRE